MKFAIYFLLLISIASCQSKSASTDRGDAHHAATAGARIGQAAHADSVAPFKFSMHISASGMGPKPYDAFTMDTNGMMAVVVSRRLATGKFQNLHAMAQLEPQDFDTLRTLIEKGRLYAIDSNDISQVCAESELYHLDIVPLVGHKPILLSFSGCAADYNLLLEPQRKYFHLLMDWWERLRVKYRPGLPEY